MMISAMPLSGLSGLYDNLTALGRSVGVAGLRVAGLGIYLVVAPRGEPSTVHCGTLVAGFAIVREGKAALNIP